MNAETRPPLRKFQWMATSVGAFESTVFVRIFLRIFYSLRKFGTHVNVVDTGGNSYEMTIPKIFCDSRLAFVRFFLTILLSVIHVTSLKIFRTKAFLKALRTYECLLGFRNLLGFAFNSRNATVLPEFSIANASHSITCIISSTSTYNFISLKQKYALRLVSHAIPHVLKIFLIQVHFP